MALCKWNGGACERETNDPSGLCSEHRGAKAQAGSGLEKFLTDLKQFVGATIWQGSPAFVSQGAPYTLSPCMHDAALFEKAVASGRAEKRVLTVAGGLLTHKLEIVAAKAQRFRIPVSGVDIEVEVDNPPLTAKDEELIRKLVTTGRTDGNARNELQRRGIRLV